MNEKITNIKIRRMILPVAFSLIIGLMFVTNYVANSKLQSTYESMLSSISRTNSMYELLKTMTKAGITRTQIITEMFDEEDPFVIDELFMKISASDTTFVVAREIFSPLIHDDNLKALLEEQGTNARIFVPRQNKVIDYLRQGEREKAKILYADDTYLSQNRNVDIIKQMLDYQYVIVKSQHQKSLQEKEEIEKLVNVFNAISVIISFLLASYVIRRQYKSDIKLNTMANIDALTGLRNRTSFIKVIEKNISYKSSPFAIIFFDIDYFKTVNDNYGHVIGDEILKRFSSRISEYIKAEDILSRFGGDEFVLMLRSVTSKDDVIKFIRKLSNDLDTSFMVDKQEIFVSSSIGVSLYPDDGVDAKSLLQRADMAMYAAKDTGRKCYHLYSKSIQQKLEREHEISHALQTILKGGNIDNELYLKYQPLIALNEIERMECEALIRWRTKDGKMIPTDEFIELAEKNNLIEKINILVINEACKQQLAWRNSGISNIRINVNLSGNKMIFKRMLTQFVGNIDRMQLDYDQFGIELTERTLYEICDDTIDKLKVLRGKGMKISIDDFGTDYSSLISLKKLPITTLKIDKLFINELPRDKDDCSLVKTIISLGHSLNLDIVAEGVETAEQYKFLKKNNCNFIQGYYFHKPLDSDQIQQVQQMKQVA